MLGLSPVHIMALTAVILLVFGSKGKISSIMGDIGGGFKALRKGLAEDPEEDERKKFIEESKRITKDDHLS